MKNKINKEKLSLSSRIDKIILAPYLGLFLFFFIMFSIFQVTFILGNLIKNFIEINFKNLEIFIKDNIPYDIVVSLINNGIINGFGVIISFLPNLVILFLILTFLEETGYMSRVAQLTDKFMHFFGLQGKSFISLFTGIGCSVPAILSTRTLTNKAEKMATIMAIPLVSCSGRLPIYLLFISTLFPEKYQGIILFSIYFLGIILSVFTAKIMRIFFFKENNNFCTPKLPKYKIPSIKIIFKYTWSRIEDFIIRSGRVIIIVVFFVWTLSYFPLGVRYGSQQSILGQIGTFIAPIFEPIGFGNYPATLSLLSGIIAKEVVVTTLGTIYGATGVKINEVISNYWTPLQAYSFLIMSSIYIPCIATLSLIKKETNSFKWVFFIIIYTLLIGYIFSFIVYQCGKLLLNIS